MKNIHVLPTDKPSRLVYYETCHIEPILQLVSTTRSTTSSDYKYQNIYITSDEEIKEGDWMHYKHFGEDIVTKYDTMGGQNTNVNEHKDYYKKIILTTDQSLNGVQAIDDEFLEWFVKNPSCEEVEIKEIEVEDYVGFAGHTSYPTFHSEYKIIIPKQETLEEAAERISKTNSVYETAQDDFYHGFIDGAKWQAEQFKYYLQKLNDLCGNK